VAQAFSQTVGETADTTTYRSTIIIQEGLFLQNVEETITISRTGSIETTLSEERPSTDSLISRLPAVGTPFGFGLGTNAANVVRSDQLMQQAIHDLDGRFLGTVQLSQGPAYGRSVLTSVAWGWGIAGVVATVLAGLVGWWMSWRLTRPLGLLTAVTTQMAAGDLTVRSPVIRQDELGTLSHSFNQMAEQVEQNVISLRQFVADAAHEFRTPLTSLHTYLEICAANTNQDEQRRRLQQADAQVFRLLALTNGLLDLAWIHTESAIPQHTAVDLSTLLQSSSELYASRAEQSAINFQIQATQPVLVLGNEKQLRQAVHNLLDNALKFTPDEGDVVVIMRKEGGQAMLEVKDTGIGIPEADRAYLFGRFHRGRNATTYPGNGLGLAIVKAIVDAHAGQVIVASGDWGTAVTLQLPAVPGQ
jgi:signal transduction histidine kinase